MVRNKANEIVNKMSYELLSFQTEIDYYKNDDDITTGDIISGVDILTKNLKSLQKELIKTLETK